MLAPFANALTGPIARESQGTAEATPLFHAVECFDLGCVVCVIKHERSPIIALGGPVKSVNAVQKKAGDRSA